MSRLIVNAGGEAAAAFLKARTGCALTSDARTIQALLPSGEITGVVAYDHWTTTSVMAHVAVDSPIAVRALLEPAFRYPFEHCGRSILIGLVSSANHRAMRLDKHVGFREVARIRDGCAEGADLVVMEMRKEDCRYLKARESAT